MITKETYLGDICFTKEYIRTVVSQAVSECIGVARLNSTNLRETLLSDVFGLKVPGIGVKARSVDNEAVISVYISAVYGINLKTVVKSVKNKVYFTLNDTIGIPVRSVNVYVEKVENL